MQPEDGPDEVSGESVATTGQQEDPPEGTAGDTLAGTGHPEVEPDENLPENTELQVAQQTPPMADHIQQHQDIEAAAQDRADAAIQRIRREIESQYHFAFDRAIRGNPVRPEPELQQEARRDHRAVQGNPGGPCPGILRQAPGPRGRNPGQPGAARPADGRDPVRDQARPGRGRASAGKNWKGTTDEGSQPSPRTPRERGRNNSSSTGRSALTQPET